MMKRIVNSLGRELRMLRQHPRYLILLTVGILFSYVFFLTFMHEGLPENLPIAVVDHDGSYLSRRLCHELNATQGVAVVAVYDTHREAREAMQRQEIFAFVEIPAGTYSAMLDFKAPHLALYSNNAYLLSGTLSYKTLSTIGKLASAAVQREVLRKKGMSETQIMGMLQPVEIDAHLISNPWGSYLPYVLTTMLPGIIGVMALLFTIYMITNELKHNTYQVWLETANGDMLSALLGKLLPYTFWFTLCSFRGLFPTSTWPSAWAASTVCSPSPWPASPILSIVCRPRCRPSATSSRCGTTISPTPRLPFSAARSPTTGRISACCCSFSSQA